MQIATWNVNSIRTRQQIVTDWLQNNSVDILCLQETKVQNEQFPVTHFTELGYHVYISGQKSYNGVAIFSREPLKEVMCGFGSVLGKEIIQQFDEQKRVISAVIGNLQIVNLYVPNGSAVGSEKYQYKLAWLALLKQYLQTIQAKQSREICICGDFNIALEDRDIYNPTKGKTKHIMASAEERSALQEVLSLGLQDAFRKFTAEQGYYTWWDYRAAGFQRDRGWRIDHHYLTSQLYEQTTKCWIDLEPRKLEKPSDHAPVILEIEM